jgi:hypothetical protein
MAAPLIAKAIRTYYRDAKGRFISKAQYEINKARNPVTGKVMSKQQLARTVDKQKSENFFREKFGNPPAGKTWVQIVAKYPGKFEDYID